MTASTLSIGLLGYGFMGKTHASSIARHPRARLAGVYSAPGDRAVVEALGVPFHDDWKALLDMPGLDAVVIATPTFTHADMAIAAMEKGLHVFLEKPMELTVDKCRAINEAASKHDVRLGLGHVLRFDPLYRSVKANVDAGKVGTPGLVRCTRRGPAPGWGTWFFDEALSGGVILDLSIHDVDMVCWIAGKRPARVSAVAAPITAGGRTFPGVSHACLEFDPPGLQVAFVEASWAASPSYPFSTSIEVAGDAGLLSCSVPGKHPFEVYTCESRVAMNLYDTDAYYNELDGFVVAVTGGLPPAVTGADGLHAVETCLAAITSARSGRTIELGGSA